MNDSQEKYPYRLGAKRWSREKNTTSARSEQIVNYMWNTFPYNQMQYQWWAVFKNLNILHSLKYFRKMFYISFHLKYSIYSHMIKIYRLPSFIENEIGDVSRALAVIFHVHWTTAARHFKIIFETLSNKCKNLIKWPSKEVVQELIPDAFKLSYRTCRVVIDCTEFSVEQPPKVNQCVHFYSHYKKGYTVKVLVGCTPSGFISFLSRSCGGRTSDTQITNRSGLLSLFEPVVLADKGCSEIKTRLEELGKNVLFVMPPFLRS